MFNIFIFTIYGNFYKMLSMLNVWFLLENELKITINWGILTGVQYFIISIKTVMLWQQ